MESRYILEKLEDYKSFIDNCADNERDKIDRLPEELISSRGVEEGLENLTNLDDCIESTITTIEDILYDLNIKLRKKRGRKIDTDFLDSPSNLGRSKENRSVRLQFLVTPTAEAHLKAYCKKNNLAMNELINRLIQELN